MGALKANWLRVELDQIDADVQAWSGGVKESFLSHYATSQTSVNPSGNRSKGGSTTVEAKSADLDS